MLFKKGLLTWICNVYDYAGISMLLLNTFLALSFKKTCH